MGSPTYGLDVVALAFAVVLALLIAHTWGEEGKGVNKEGGGEGGGREFRGGG